MAQLHALTAAEHSALAGHAMRRRFGEWDRARGLALDVTDGLRLLVFLFIGGGDLAPGGGCLEAADANDDGELDCTDAIHTLGWLFRGAAPPPPPGPAPMPCGHDPDPPGLGCETYAPCR